MRVDATKPSKQKILVIGASSYVGARLYSDLMKKYDVFGTYNSRQLFPELLKLDITNSSAVRTIVQKIKPDWIIHVAANPNAKWCEANPDQAIALNTDGTKNIVKSAQKNGAKIIYISSTAAINPTNLYGRTKSAGEEIVMKSLAGYIILQPSLIIGYSPNTENDRPFNRILKNFLSKTPAEYDNSWKFQPTWLGHISEVIDLCIQGDILKQIIPISVPELKTRLDIAADILKGFGMDARALDSKDNSPVTIVSQDKLRELKFPIYKYEEIIQKIIKETKTALGIE